MRYSLTQRTLATTLLAAGTLLGLTLAGYLPALGALVLPVAGLPACLIALAWGVTWFLIYGILTVSMISVIGGLFSGVVSVSLWLAPAAFLAWAVKLRQPPLRVLGLALFSSFLLSSGVWSLAPLFGKAGQDLQPLRQQIILEGEKKLSELENLRSQEHALDEPEGVQVIMGQMRSWIEFMALLAPYTYLFCWHLVSVFMIYSGAHLLAGFADITVEPLPPFSQWRFNWNFIWLFMAGWLIFYGIESDSPSILTDLLRVLGANLLAIAKILFFIAGFSLVFYFFEAYKISPVYRFGLSLLALFMSQVLVWLGIADIWLDFRAPKTATVGPMQADDDDDDPIF